MGEWDELMGSEWGGGMGGWVGGWVGGNAYGVGGCEIDAHPTRTGGEEEYEGVGFGVEPIDGLD